MLVRRKKLKIEPRGGRRKKAIQTAQLGKSPFRSFQREFLQRRSDNPHNWKLISYSFVLLRLHEEILDFHNFMKPRPAEHRMRQEVISRVQEVIKQLWPTAEVRRENSHNLLNFFCYKFKVSLLNGVTSMGNDEVLFLSNYFRWRSTEASERASIYQPGESK